MDNERKSRTGDDRLLPGAGFMRDSLRGVPKERGFLIRARNFTGHSTISRAHQGREEAGGTTDEILEIS